jgi:hypothetical protein
MKVQLKRIVRTWQSEQYGLFDLDRLDEDGLPVSLGKLDLHYIDEGTYGTLLLWGSQFETTAEDELELFVQRVIDELSAPMGVSGEFLIECMLAADDEYRVYSNMVEA